MPRSRRWRTDPDGAAQWLTLDEGYRAFAEAQFLELTPEAAGAAQALLGSEMQGKTLPEILQAIRQTLTEHFVYDESVSTQNGTQDFSNMFSPSPRAATACTMRRPPC